MYFSKKRILRWLIQIFQLRDNAESVGHGLALGVFIGFAVPWGAQLATAFALAWVLGVNRIAALVAANVTNVFTVGPIYLTGYWLGRLLLGFPEKEQALNLSNEVLYNPHSMWELLKDLGLPLMLGNTVLGIICAAATYLLFIRFTRHYHRRRSHKR
jgi:uncharacterized protein